MQGEAHMLRLVSPICLDNLLTLYLTVPLKQGFTASALLSLGQIISVVGAVL